MQRKCEFYYRHAIFLLLPSENELLQMFWTINAESNQEFTMKHWENILCELCGRFFWSFLHQYHLALWSSERKLFFSDDTPEIYSRLVKKPSLKLKLFLAKRGWNFQKFTKLKKPIEFHIGSQAPKVPPPQIGISHVFVILGGNIL